MIRRFIVASLLLLLAGCGPIIGAAMVAGGGVKDFTVVDGQLQALRPGAQLLVVGPFDKTPQAYYICRGEEAAEFVSAFNTNGLFQADFHLAERFTDNTSWLKELKEKSPEQIQAELKLDRTPELLLTGVILHRSTVAAPAQGVLMRVGYRLQFYDLRSRQTTAIDIEVKDIFQDCVAAAANALAEKLSSR
jgi:hypothetical protein